MSNSRDAAETHDASCRRCGAPIRWVGAPLAAVDQHEQIRGADRVIDRDGQLIAVRADADILAMHLHRCAA